jgi:hypothetical protein
VFADGSIKVLEKLFGQNLTTKSDHKKGRQTPEYVPFWSKPGKMQSNYLLNYLAKANV